MSYGKVKLVLKRNQYYVESAYPNILWMLLADPVVSSARVTFDPMGQPTTEHGHLLPKPAHGGSIPPTDLRVRDRADGMTITNSRSPREWLASVVGADDDEADEDEHDFHSFQVSNLMINVRAGSQATLPQSQLPFIRGHDFRNDTLNRKLDIDLKSLTVIQSYQGKCLGKMFGNGRARSGIMMTDAAGVVVSTDSMVAHTGRRSLESKRVMELLTSREWVLVILGEVHVVPADIFSRVITTVRAHSKLGLTATLVREYDRIEDLNYMIGPKLYETNWMDLAAKGHIATVQCAEVRCIMTSEFHAEYLRASNREKMFLWCMSPNKFRACQFLINYHEKRGDKVIVFSDNVFALKEYARTFGRPFICGDVSQTERVRILEAFQHDSTTNTIFLSKIGDTSIDLPEAKCLIQISSHFGSRRQEAQRLGRILRAKRRNDEGFHTYFYSLVSQDTDC
ncbi:hypothetical protein FRB90_004787 [Tulasnella sp. 427]|nr:hypothetical protein FRB90_004787 [Tulasnella sp. 427]